MENNQNINLNQPSPKGSSNLSTRILIQVLMGIFYFFNGLAVIFFSVRLISGSPFSGIAGNKVTMEYIIAMEEEIGLSQPVMKQFFQFLGRIFTFNWGESLSVSPGESVWTLIWEKAPRSIEIVFFAMILALPVGILLGYLISHKHAESKEIKARYSIVASILAIYILGGSIFTSIFYKTFLRFNFFPTQGYISIYYTSILRDMKITGFGMLDSFMHFNFTLWFDIVKHLFYPAMVLSYIMIFPVMMITRRMINQNRKSDASKRKSRSISGYLFMALYGNIILIIVGIIEYTFNIYGIVQLFFNAMSNRDYFLIQAIGGFYLLIFIGIPFIINLVNIIVNKNHFQEKIDDSEPQLQTAEKTDLKPNQTSTTLQQWIKNPWIIAGCVGMFMILLFSILAPIFYDKALLSNLNPNAWAAPSAEHVWGTMQYGADVMGRFLFGFQPVLTLLLIVLFVGELGYFIGNQLAIRSVIGRDIIKAFLNYGLFLPLLILLIGGRAIFLWNSIVILSVWGFLIMLRVGMYVAEISLNIEESNSNSTALLFKGLPYLFGVMILLFTVYISLFYLGYGDDGVINWGTDFAYNRSMMKSAPWIIWEYLGVIIVNLTMLAFTVGSINNQVLKEKATVLV